MAGELVNAYIRLTPTVAGMQGATARALAPATAEASAAGTASGRAFGGMFGMSAKRVIGFGLGLVSAVAIKRFIGSSTDAFKELNAEVKGLQRTAGGTIPEVSALRGALQLSGVTVPKATISLKIFSKQLAGAASDAKKSAAMQKLLGTEFTTSKGHVEDFTTLLPKVADTFKAMEDGPNKSALALKLFGRSGIDMLPFLNKGADGISELEAQAKKLGITLDDASQEKWMAYRQETRRADAAMMGLKVTVGAAVLPMFTRFSTLLTDELIPAFSSVITWLKTSDQVKSFTSTVMSGFDSLQRTVDGVKQTVGSLDFNNIDGAKLGKSLSSGLSHALDDLGSLSSKLFDKIGEVMGQVDWVGLGITVGTQAIPFVLGLATGIINGVSDPGLWKGIWHHLPDILLALLAVAFAPSKIAGPLGRVLGRIPFAGKFLEAIVKGLQGIGSKITGVAGEMLGSLWKGLVGGRFAGSGIGKLIEKVMFPFLQLYPRVASFGLRFGQRLLQAGHSGMRYLGVAISDGIASVLRFFIRLPGRMLRALGSLARLLWPSGGRVIGGLLSGARDRFGSVLSWVGRIGSRIKGAIKGAGKLLSGIGGSIVDGLLSGLRGAWHKVTDWLSNKINGLSKVAKKLLHINSPSKVFSEIGHSIGEGMQEGIAASMPLVDAAVGNMATGAVRAGSTAARGSYATGRAGRAGVVPAAAGPQLSGRMTMTNWKDGTGHFELIAEGVASADRDYQGSVDRMAGRR